MADPKLETEVQVLKTNLEYFHTILEKFDTTINKLTEVSNTLNKVIAVQESRIDGTEKSIERAHKRIDHMEEEFEKEMSRNTSAILDEIKELRLEQNSHSKEMSNRITKLEKWKYSYIGGAIVIGFLLSQSGLVANIFAKLVN